MCPAESRHIHEAELSGHATRNMHLNRAPRRAYGPPVRVRVRFRVRVRLMLRPMLRVKAQGHISAVAVSERNVYTSILISEPKQRNPNQSTVQRQCCTRGYDHRGFLLR